MKFALIAVFVVFFVAGQKHVEAQRDLRSESQIITQFIKYVNKQQTYLDSVEFRKIVEILSVSKYILKDAYDTFTKERQDLSCIACRSVMSVFVEMRRNGKTEEEIGQVAADLCTLLQVQSERVCRGVVALNIPILIHIIDNVPDFSPDSFCGILLQTDDKDSCSFEDERYEWTVDVPERKSLKTGKSNNNKADSIKIVHISDIHYDPEYSEDGIAECNEPMCCRKDQEQKFSPRHWGVYDDEEISGRLIIDEKHNYYLDLNYADTVREARMRGVNKYTNKNKAKSSKPGYWGDYRDCDMPWRSIDDAVTFIVDNHEEIDYIYYTGDTVDHSVWATTQEYITDIIVNTTQKLYQAFGDRPVYQVIGNHESQPTNQFASPLVAEEGLSTAWLYDLLWDQWKRWLPAEAEQTLKKGGYYTVVPRPGFRIIALNTNLCYRYNWWVQYEPKFAREQLMWMIDVLLQAEANNEKVHILSHIPTGKTDCVAVYTREYKKIIERFSDIITGEFNGHTHKDEFKMFYTKGTRRPVMTAWNGGSLTSFSNVNPNYRVYDVDGSTYEMNDIETWVYNLTEANLTPEQRPRWFLEYSFKSLYNVTSLQPEDLDSLMDRFVSVDKDLLITNYHQYRGKSSDPFVNRICNDACVENNLKYLFITELYDNTKFNEMRDKFFTRKYKQ